MFFLFRPFRLAEKTSAVTSRVRDAGHDFGQNRFKDKTCFPGVKMTGHGGCVVVVFDVSQLQIGLSSQLRVCTVLAHGLSHLLWKPTPNHCSAPRDPKCFPKRTTLADSEHQLLRLSRRRAGSEFGFSRQFRWGVLLHSV